LALWYWSIKIAWLRLFNRNIVGAYQGIGPTYGSLSRRLVTFAVNRTRRFAVRDTESMEKLVAWGVPAEKLIAATDPAIMASGVSGTPTNPISDDILDDFIAIAPRDWFHYETGGVVPHRFQSQKPSAENARYIEHLVQLIEYASQQTGHIVLVPMHMHQDVDFCRSLAERVSADVPVTVLADDHIRPRQLRTLLARAKCMIGFRLHATIIATAAGVPSVNFYYVDKGRVYFDQIDMAEFAFPIEALLEPQQGGAIQAAIRAVIDDRASVKNTLAARLDSLREELKASFRNLCE
ncbi:MAG: polysaccharide pyruvyl transferase family protein, partial [Pseudomonadota bacterium]